MAADADAFDLRLDGKVKGALRFTVPFPNFEAMDSADGDNVYEVVVTASDGMSSSSKTVTVTVENVEEVREGGSCRSAGRRKA